MVGGIKKCMPEMETFCRRFWMGPWESEGFFPGSQ